MDYETLYQKYLKLLEENKKLRKKLRSIKFKQEQGQGDNLDNSADKSYIPSQEQDFRESKIQESGIQESEPRKTELITSPQHHHHKR